MTTKSNVNPVLLTVLVALSFASICLTFSGVYNQEWWGGFGFVLFMTSLLMWVGILNPPSPIAIDKKEERPANKAA